MEKLLERTTKTDFPWKAIVAFLVFSFLLSCENSNESLPPSLENGVIEISPNQWETKKIIALKGNWKWVSGDKVDPEKFLEHKDVKIIEVPNSLQDSSYSNSISATYYLQIQLPVNLSKQDQESLSIHLDWIGNSYTAFANGVKIGSRGDRSNRMGYSQRINWGSDIWRLYPNGLQLDSKTEKIQQIDLVIQISNQDHITSSIWKIPFLGTFENLTERKEKSKIKDLIFFGAFLILGFYYLGYIFSWKIDLSRIFFALFCFILAFRILVIEERSLLLFFPDFDALKILQFEYLTFYIGVLVFTLYFKYLFPIEYIKFFNNLILIVFLGFCILTFIYPFHIFSKWLYLPQILTLFLVLITFFTNIKAIINSRLGAKTFFYGFVIFGSTTIYDVLIGMGLIQGSFLVSYGFLFFILVQAYIMNFRFTYALEESRALTKQLVEQKNSLVEKSNQLEEMTKNLEVLVEERTLDINKINQFTNLVNSLPSINDIFAELNKYFYERFGIIASWLFLPDEKGKNLFVYKAYSYKKLNENIYEYTKNYKIPLNPDGGTLYEVFKRKKSFYLPKIPSKIQSIDEEFMKVFQLQSLLDIPLVRLEKCIGILAFSNLKEKMILDRKQIKNISNLCSQIASAIDTNRLLVQLEEEKLAALKSQEEAERNKEEIEKQKREVDALNTLVKSLNDEMDLKMVMKKVHHYIQSNYGLNYYGLGILNEDLGKTQIFELKSQDWISEENRKKVSALQIDTKEGEGGHAIAFKSKKPMFAGKMKDLKLNPQETEIIEILNIESILILPLIVESNIIGFLDLYNEGQFHLKKEERVRLSILAEHLAGVIYRSNLMEKLQKTSNELNGSMKLIKSDHAVAKKIQENILLVHPEVPLDFEFYSKYLPQTEVGGDFYDIDKIGEGTYRLFVADATGHGVQAAMMTMGIKGIYENIKKFEMSVNELLTIFNYQFDERFNSLNNYLTAILIDIHLDKQELVFASAGHPPGLIIDKNGNKKLLEKTGKLIGVSSSNHYELRKLSFEKDERLYVLTDGVFEEFDSDYQEYGEERMWNYLIENRDRSIKDCIEGLYKDVSEFTANGFCEDDFTILGLKF